MSKKISTKEEIELLSKEKYELIKATINKYILKNMVTTTISLKKVLKKGSSRC